jgi:hypothetical protein
MRRKGQLLKRLAAVLFVATMAASPSAIAADPPTAPASEVDLKVAFLLNFARFVKWPGPTATNDEPFVVGVFDLEPLREPLAQLERKTVRDRAFRVRHCRGTNDVAGCHILFINASEPEIQKSVLAAVKDKPVLTVGEAPEFLAEGGIVRFVLRNDRLRLQMSRLAATRAGLELSARLLEIAEKVVDEL